MRKTWSYAHLTALFCALVSAAALARHTPIAVDSAEAAGITTTASLEICHGRPAKISPPSAPQDTTGDACANCDYCSGPKAGWVIVPAPALAFDFQRAHAEPGMPGRLIIAFGLEIVWPPPRGPPGRGEYHRRAVAAVSRTA